MGEAFLVAGGDEGRPHHGADRDDRGRARTADRGKEHACDDAAHRHAARYPTDERLREVDQALVKAIYDVATALNKHTIAEFVEDQHTLGILADIGITYAQGYHLGKPKPIEQLFN